MTKMLKNTIQILSILKRNLGYCNRECNLGYCNFMDYPWECKVRIPKSTATTMIFQDIDKVRMTHDYIVRILKNTEKFNIKGDRKVQGTG